MKNTCFYFFYKKIFLIIFFCIIFLQIESETSYDTCQYLNSNTDAFNWYRNGIVLASGASISLATPYTIGSRVGGNGIGFSKSNGTLSLKCDLCLGNSTAIGSGTMQGTSTGISGTHCLILDGNVTLSGNLSIGYPLIIDGRGHDLDFYDFYNHAQRYIRIASSYSSLEIRNTVLKNFNVTPFDPIWAAVSNSGGLTLENTIIELTGNVYMGGSGGTDPVKINGLTVIRGNGHTITFWTPITIQKNAILYIDKGVNLIVKSGLTFTMQDSTSKLYFDGCTITLDTGNNSGSNIIINQGAVFFDNKVVITDNNAATPKRFDFMSNAQLNLLAALRLEIAGTAILRINN